MSEFSRDPQVGAFTYRLRVAGLWFEQERITADSTGSRAELRIAPKLDAGWHAHADRDRIAPLKRCLAG